MSKTCQDCRHLAPCAHRTTPADCPFFEPKKRTRFDRLRSSVDEMAEALVWEKAAVYIKPRYGVTGVYDKYWWSREQAIAAAKAWLLEVEK